MKKDTSEQLDHISMQFDYVAKAFKIAIVALEDISQYQQVNGEFKTEYRIAQKALKTIKALTDEACTEEEDI